MNVSGFFTHVLSSLEFWVSAEVWKLSGVGGGPQGGYRSPICYLKGQLRGGTHCGIFFLLQASHYYKYRQQFIFPGEFPVSSVSSKRAHRDVAAAVRGQRQMLLGWTSPKRIRWNHPDHRLATGCGGRCKKGGESKDSVAPMRSQSTNGKA